MVCSSYDLRPRQRQESYFAGNTTVYGAKKLCLVKDATGRKMMSDSTPTLVSTFVHEISGQASSPNKDQRKISNAGAKALVQDGSIDTNLCALSSAKLQEVLHSFKRGEITAAQIKEMASGLEVAALAKRTDLEQFKELFEAVRNEGGGFKGIVSLFCSIFSSGSVCLIDVAHSALAKIQQAEKARYERALELYALLDTKQPSIDKVKMLLAEGVDLEFRYNGEPSIAHKLSFKGRYGGTTLLHLAAVQGNTEAVETLLAYGVDLHAKDWILEEIAPLSALRNGSVETAKVILRVGMDRYTQEERSSCLLASASIGDEELVKMLLDAGVPPDCSDIYGVTALEQAADYGHINIVRLLLALGVNPNVQNMDKDTPLHKSALAGNTEIVELLVKAGGDPDLKNWQNLTPFSNAMKGQHREIMRIFLNIDGVVKV